jgi:hypothetical protein
MKTGGYLGHPTRSATSDLRRRQGGGRYRAHLLNLEDRAGARVARREASGSYALVRDLVPDFPNFQSTAMTVWKFGKSGTNVLVSTTLVIAALEDAMSLVPRGR